MTIHAGFVPEEPVIQDELPNWHWSVIKVLTPSNDGGSNSPVLALDSHDNIHMVWYDSTDYNGAGTDNDVYYCKFNSTTRSWGDIKLLSDFSQMTSVYPVIAIDNSDNIHVFWGENEDYAGAGTDRDIFYRRYDSQTGQWSDPLLVSAESSGISYAVTVVISSSNVVHIVWVDTDGMLNSGTDHDIFYKSYTPQTGELSPLRLVTDQSTANAEVPKMEIDPMDNIHLFWTDSTDYLGAGTDSDVFYRYFNNASSLWSEDILISDQSTGSTSRPDLAIDQWNNLHLVWTDNTNYMGSGTDIDLVYRQYNLATQSWGQLEVLSTNSSGNVYSPDIEVDSFGKLYVVWEDSTDYNGAGVDYDIFYTTYDMSTYEWNSHIDLSGTNTSSRSPDLLIDRSDTIHIVWADSGISQGEGTDTDLFYRSYGGFPSPTHLAAIQPNPSQGSVMLSWEQAHGALSYSVYRTTKLPFQFITNELVGQTKVTSMYDQITEPGQYFYAVVAENNWGSSEFSNIEVVNVVDSQLSEETTTVTEQIETTITTTVGQNEVTVTTTVSGNEVTVTQNNSEAKSPVDPVFILLGLVSIILVIPYHRRHR